MQFDFIAINSYFFINHLNSISYFLCLLFNNLVETLSYLVISIVAKAS